MQWFSHYVPRFHAGEWLALAMVISVAPVPGVPYSNLSSRCVRSNTTKTRVRGIIGAHLEDKRVVSAQEIVCAFGRPGRQFPAPFHGWT